MAALVVLQSKLREFEPGAAAGPAVLPALLLLERLYPTAAEGAAFAFKVTTANEDPKVPGTDRS